MVLQLHRTPEEEENKATHDDPCVDPELIICEEDWVNYEKHEGNFGPKLVAAPTQEEWRKFERLKVCEIVKEEELKRDPKAIKIGTKWVVTNEGTKTKPMVRARLVGKEFADHTKKGELLAGSPEPPAAVLSVQASNQQVR